MLNEILDLQGQELLSSINFSANPCDNFYNFACGKWIESNPIPEKQTSVSKYQLVAKLFHQRLKGKTLSF